MPVWFRVLIAVAIVNFVSFCTIASAYGGSALNGKVAEGKFYVGKKGQFTEVSKTFYLYSRAHEISMFATHLGVIGISFFLTIRKSFET